MATVIATTSFTGWLKRDELGPRPKTKAGKPVGVEEGIADGLPARNQYGDLIQEVKEGEKIKVFEGQMFDSNHPAVRKWPTLFGQPSKLGLVEQATAAPGEKR